MKSIHLITDPVASGSIYSSPPVASTTLGLSPWSSYPALPACTKSNPKNGNLPWGLGYGKRGPIFKFTCHRAVGGEWTDLWTFVKMVIRRHDDSNVGHCFFHVFPVILGQWDWWQVREITFGCWKNPIPLATKRIQSPNQKCWSPRKKTIILLPIPSMYRIYTYIWLIFMV